MSGYVNTSWLDAMQDVSAAIDDEFGEPVIYIPTLKQINAKPIQQPERGVFLKAVFTWRSETVLQSRSPMSSGGLVETRKPTFSFSREALPFGLERGDIIVRQADGCLFEITGVEPDGVSRIVVRTVQMGLQHQ